MLQHDWRTNVDSKKSSNSVDIPLRCHSFCWSYFLWYRKTVRSRKQKGVETVGVAQPSNYYYEGIEKQLHLKSCTTICSHHMYLDQVYDSTTCSRNGCSITMAFSHVKAEIHALIWKSLNYIIVTRSYDTECRNTHKVSVSIKIYVINTK